MTMGIGEGRGVGAGTGSFLAPGRLGADVIQERLPGIAESARISRGYVAGRMIQVMPPCALYCNIGGNQKLQARSA